MAPKNSKITRLEDLLIGLESQMRSLQMLLSEFKQNDQGGSCLLSGRRYSGKTLMLNHVLKQLFPDDGKKDGIRFETIDGNDYNNFASTTKLFDQLGLGAMVEKQRDFEFEQWGKEVKNNKATTPKKSSKSATPKKTKTNIIPDDGEMEQRIEKILFLVDHFENFAKKYNQNFLYGILNGSQSFPWFVILVGTSENSVNILEKRVRSRLSKIRINFNVAFSLEQFKVAFHQLADSSSIPKNIIKELDEESELDHLIERFHQRQNGIGWLKQWIQLFALVIPNYENLDNLTPLRILGHCWEALLPENEQLRTLEGLSIRQLCLLNCLFHLEESNRRIELGYREIVTEYYRFANENARQMSVRDTVLFKDLDELLELSLLVPARKMETLGLQQFKKVLANVEQEAIQMTVERRRATTPRKIVSWFISN